MRIRVDADPDGEEIEQGGQQRRRHDPGVGNPRELYHHKSAGTHKRGHDLAARRGNGLNGAGDAFRITQSSHGRHGDRTG